MNPGNSHLHTPQQLIVDDLVMKGGNWFIPGEADLVMKPGNCQLNTAKFKSNPDSITFRLLTFTVTLSEGGGDSHIL